MHHTFTRTVLAALAIVVALATQAAAHPHVWVTMKSELVYAPDGSVTGIRHAWSFDDMFSAFATQGIESKQKGAFTREELAPLAEVNISSLKDFDYFTHARANGKKATFNPPAPGYFLEFKDSVLTLHFTLPLAAPVKTQNFEVDVYDGTWFVDFAFAKENPVVLAGAPAQCTLAFARPRDASAAQPPQLGESFFNSLDQASNYGAQFANKISVKCP